MKTEGFCRAGEAISPEPYPYKACGLEGIFLLNGYTRDEKHGGVKIKDIDGLHKEIGRHLVMHRKILAPREIKFLRNTMDLTQAELATKLGNDVQTIARWEKGMCDIPGPAEKLLRLFYIFSLLSEDELKELVTTLVSKLEQLDQFDEVRAPTAQFCLSDRWNEKPEVVAA